MNMEWSEVFKLVTLIFGSTLSSGGIISLLINFFFNKFSVLYENRIKAFLDIYKDSEVRYNQQQFEKYNEIWASLFDLKMAADSLWHEATGISLGEYSKKLKIAFGIVGKNALFIEEAHYKELIDLFNAFGSYEYGKKNLLTSRLNSNNIKGELYWIESNRKILEEYTDLIEKIRKSFRDQLHFKNPEL